MNIDDYRELKKCGFLGYGGCVQSYWDNAERKHNPSEIIDNIDRQKTDDLDFKNCVILFPLATQMGSTCLIKGTPIDHCTNILSVANFLGKNGVTWKDGSEMKSGQHLSRIGMLIVHEGVALATTISDPTDYGNLAYHPGISDSNLYYRYENGDAHKISKVDLIFSGMFIDKFCRN